MDDQSFARTANVVDRRSLSLFSEEFAHVTRSREEGIKEGERDALPVSKHVLDCQNQPHFVTRDKNLSFFFIVNWCTCIDIAKYTS